MNRQNRRQVPTAKQQINALKRSLHGHRNEIRHVSPPQVTRRPWYPLVVDFVKPESGIEVFFTPSEICNILVNQLGLPAQASSVINIKVQRVDCYAMAVGGSTDRPAVSLDCSSVVASVGDPATPGNAEVFYSILKKLRDQGNLSDAAKCSYTWPAHMADIPMSSQSVFTLVQSSGNMPNTLTRFHLLWSASDIATPL